MSDAKKKVRRWLALSMAAAATVGGPTLSSATTWLWDPQHTHVLSSGSGNWTDTSWYNGATDTTWVDTSFLTADFGGTAGAALYRHDWKPTDRWWVAV